MKHSDILGFVVLLLLVNTWRRHRSISRNSMQNAK